MSTVVVSKTLRRTLPAPLTAGQGLLLVAESVKFWPSLRARSLGSTSRFVAVSPRHEEA